MLLTIFISFIVGMLLHYCALRIRHYSSIFVSSLKAQSAIAFNQYDKVKVHEYAQKSSFGRREAMMVYFFAGIVFLVFGCSSIGMYLEDTSKWGWIPFGIVCLAPFTALNIWTIKTLVQGWKTRNITNE